MNRRRKKQIEYNKKNNIEPKTIIKAVQELDEFKNLSKQETVNYMVSEEQLNYDITSKNIDTVIKKIEAQMKEAAENLDFESASILRDRMLDLKSMKSGNVSPKCKISKKIKK
ncbi:MAG: UvrB/UvrC motif-containing protein [Endomicrobium sp.]|jgi:excinuclease ABC subunit B|nr:UvrB/UvrC motif-containing protein [Endomicrobium sp.]